MAVSHNYSNQPIPRYSHGFLLAYDYASSKVWAYKDGTLQTTATVSIPGASSFRINDVAAAPSGVLVAEATAVQAEQGVASTLVWMAPTGDTIRIVNLGTFGPRRIAFGSDGTLWALGRVRDEQYEDVPSYEMLRQYDQNGVLMRTILPNKAVNGKVHPSEGLLRLNNGYIMVHFQNAHIFVELTADGSMVGQWTIEPFPDIEFTGTALDLAGEIYVTGTAGLPTQAASVLYRLDKQSSRLMPVSNSASELPTRFVLLGADGSDLVFYGRSPQQLLWASLKR